MEGIVQSPGLIRFGVYEVDLRTNELRKRGLKIKLQVKPFQALALLIEKRGEIVTRQELRDRLWPSGIYVDFDHSLATAINKVRDVLGDSVENPRFIETVPRQGYRFIAPVESIGAVNTVPAALDIAPNTKPGRGLPFAARYAGIAAAIVIGFAGYRLVAGHHASHAPRQMIDPEVIRLYQRGRSGPLPTLDSIPFYEQAIARDPQFAPAYAGMATAYITAALNAQVSPREVMPKAKSAAMKAVELDDRLAEAHLTLGVAKSTYDWDRSGAEEQFRRALELDPEVPGGRPTYALFLAYMGRFGEALDRLPASGASPGPIGVAALHASVLFMSREYQRTAAYCQWLLAFAPGADAAEYWLGRTYAEQSRLAEGIALLERAREANKRKGTGFGMLANLYARAGRREDALKVLADMTELSRRQYVSPISIATIYIGLGDSEHAFEWLDRACNERDFSVSSLKVEPAYDPLRGDPRFEALLRRVNLKPAPAPN